MVQRSLLPILVASLVLCGAATPLHDGVNKAGEKRSATIAPNPEPTSELSEASSGYPQLFRRKTSSLLAEALHMLSRVKDVRERRWLEAFVHRLASLADDLEAGPSPGHPPQGQEKGLADFGRSLVHNAGHLQEMVAQHLGKTGGSDVQQETEELVSQLQEGRRPTTNPHHQQLMLKSNKTPKEGDARAQHREDKLKMEKVKVSLELEKKKLLKNIFAQVQKLRELGGKPQEVLEILKRTRGTQHRVPLQPTDQVSEPSFSRLSTQAPSSFGQLREDVTEVQPARATAAVATEVRHKGRQPQETDISNEETSEEDDLVKQLEEEKFILVTTPGSRQDEQ